MDRLHAHLLELAEDCNEGGDSLVVEWLGIRRTPPPEVNAVGVSDGSTSSNTPEQSIGIVSGAMFATSGGWVNVKQHAC